MKKIKRNICKILCLFCACLSIGAVANATGKTTADVEIAIEAGDIVQEPEVTNKEVRQTVKTGDYMSWIKYAVALGVAALIAIGCIWKKKKGMLAVFALVISMFMLNDSVLAADISDNVNVTIPTTISISFDESGKNSISKFDVNNQSLVPITIEKINATECNAWSLAPRGQEIPVNSKTIVFEIEDKTLASGENYVSIPIAEQTSKTMDVQVARGAWTTSSAKETALRLEFEYTIGKKEFELSFDTNGNGETLDVKKVCNGDTVKLPSPERDGYVLAGWEDEKGNLYTEQFVMPIGNTSLTAVWKEKIAYAIYSASDTSLRFIRSAEVIQPGTTYNGRIVTDVFTGFEETTYSSREEVPWYDGNVYDDRVITKVIFEDTIRPKNTAYWFYWFWDCAYVDARKLDMSQVTDMQYMLGWCSCDAPTFDIIGINEWDVSNVTNMAYALAYIGYNDPTFEIDLSKWDVSKVTNMRGLFKLAGSCSNKISLGDLSKWDVSNVTTMREMFQETGRDATWYLNVSNWNVAKVTNTYRFNLKVESKVIAPKWVN